MNTRPVRVAVIGVVAALLLGGCGADGAPPDAGPADAGSPSAGSPSAGSPSAGSPSGRERTKDRRDDRKARSADQGVDQPEGAEGAEGADDATPSPGPDAAPSTGADTDGTAEDGTADGSAPALEMPEAPAPAVDSLADLLPPSSTAPLVTTPLPRAASAQGRLLPGFPDALRPDRATRVQSSSVSPSGDRLQVGLVATSSRSPEQVLLAYRTRLARRGMAETTTPPSVAGSRAAAFRRDGSVVTVTVTARGSGTSLAVHASLRAERG